MEDNQISNLFSGLYDAFVMRKYLKTNNHCKLATYYDVIDIIDSLEIRHSHQKSKLIMPKLISHCDQRASD